MTLCPHDSAIKMGYPPQKKRPSQPLPPLPTTSNRFSAIASWAAHVQPGSPTSFSPRSPHRRPSLCKDRRPSVVSIRVPSASFLRVAPTPTVAFTPTPSLRDFKADLTTLGYASVFLQLPTPLSATLSIGSPPTKPANNFPLHPSPTCKPRNFIRFRSLSVLRSRGRSKSVSLHSPTKMKAKTAAASASIVKRKKAKYAMHPPPLANELALMQFLDGGNLDTNIKRVMEAQAKDSDVAGLANVFRDGRGGIWRDQDEVWEYAHLLEGNESHATGDPPWVTFGGDASCSIAGVPGEDRRGSVSTQDSDLDTNHVVQPADSLDDLALFGSAVVPLAARKPTASVLSLPSRPRRAAQHLQKPEFLVDAAFTRFPASPKSPQPPTSSDMGAAARPRGNARRRPAPLKLSPPSPAFKRPINSPIDTDRVRREFIDDSFAPAVFTSVNPVAPAMDVSVTTPADGRPRHFANSRTMNVPWRTVKDGPTKLEMKTKPSKLNMMRLFRSTRKEDMIT